MGLRPSQRHRLESLCHRRHPADAIADPLCLQRLGSEGLDLAMPLTLVVDGRGLCRLLWVGELEQSGRLLEKLPGPTRRQGSGLRLLTCTGPSRHQSLRPGAGEAVVGLDLAPILWLRCAQTAAAGGRWPASLWVPSGDGETPWTCLREGDLAELAVLDPEHLPADPTRAEEPDQDRPRLGSDRGERVVLLVLSGGDPALNRRRIAELEGLVRSAGATPVGIVEQRRPLEGPRAAWGEGKLREAALEARRLEASLVVTDRELSPAQGRDLERILNLPVSDRSELILDIFAQRAASAAGRLQVELAQLRYRLPRLTGRGLSLSRQGGGIGTRGPGETQLEKDRRAIARRLERLQRDVQRLGEHRARLRRSRQGLPRLALVGYTNAGKSSLLNALTRRRGEGAVLAEDRMFATLDPTTRRLTLGDGEGHLSRTLLITDTVGFIRDLPHQLMEAFRSTIEEALDADGLLIVVDLADPSWQAQLDTVNRILNSLGSQAPRQVVGNQIDRCPAHEVDRARSLEPGIIFISATADLGLTRLRNHLLHWPDSQAHRSSGSSRLRPQHQTP